MKQFNCKPGDLAVIVDAYNPENIGTFVKVIRAHKNQFALDKPEGDILWLVEGNRPMSYDISGRIRKRKNGPAPDSSMRPIRGIEELADIAVDDFKKEIYKEFARRQASLSPTQVLEKLNQKRREFIISKGAHKN
jgi:hypothetical protein